MVALGQAAEAEAAGPVVLVEDGRASCAVVAGPEVSPPERFAVEELRSFVRRMSGAELPRLAPQDLPQLAPEELQRPERPPFLVLVGRATAERLHPELDLDGLGTDGFVIKTMGDELVLAGGRKRGTLYAVYTLLESLGCRWWTPTESTIPDMPTIRVPETDRREVPRLEYRDMMYNELWRPGGTLWAVRNKVNGLTGHTVPEEYGGRVRFEGNIIHSYGRLLSRSRSVDYAARPELWALHEGERDPRHPCTTHPDVIKAVTESVRARLRQHPEEAFVVVGQNDGRVYCHGERCTEVVEREGFPSALVLGLANEVARRVEPEFPDARIMASAYHWSRRPPRYMKPRDNVMIALSSIECDFGHPLATGRHEENVSFRRDLEGWSRIAERLYVWDYATNFGHYLMPFANLDVLVPNIRFYVEHNVTGYFCQGSHTGHRAEFSPLRMWVLAKTMWNPDADGRALIGEFLEGYYGPAAPAVQRYIDTIHGPVRREDQTYVGCRQGTRLNQPWLAPRVVAEAEAHLRQAEKRVAADPPLERRVRHAHAPLWYVLARRGPSSRTWRAVSERVGGLTPGELARNLTRAFEESDISRLSESGSVRTEVWLNWLSDWGARAGEARDVLPPELAGAAPGEYRLIQGGQTHSPHRWWRRDPDAGDGWVVACDSHQWYLRYHFSERDDFVPGRRYTVFVRVKAGEPAEPGRAFGCGVHRSGDSMRREVSTNELTPGRFQAFEVGTIELKPGHSFWLALRKERAVREVRLDCLWLRPAEAE
ncbi:MAG: DUF4838 domain-containing protein [Planctomycetota bacterium]